MALQAQIAPSNVPVNRSSNEGWSSDVNRCMPCCQEVDEVDGIACTCADIFCSAEHVVAVCRLVWASVIPALPINNGMDFPADHSGFMNGLADMLRVPVAEVRAALGGRKKRRAVIRIMKAAGAAGKKAREMPIKEAVVLAAIYNTLKPHVRKTAAVAAAIKKRNRRCLGFDSRKEFMLCLQAATGKFHEPKSSPFHHQAAHPFAGVCHGRVVRCRRGADAGGCLLPHVPEQPEQGVAVLPSAARSSGLMDPAKAQTPSK